LTPAFPGLGVLDDDPEAAKWSERPGRQMYAMAVETDRFRLSAIFHGIRYRKLSAEAPFVERVLIPLA
jgi:hypothetical protein